jgi:hypothetical protein
LYFVNFPILDWLAKISRSRTNRRYRALSAVDPLQSERQITQHLAPAPVEQLRFRKSKMSENPNIANDNPATSLGGNPTEGQTVAERLRNRRTALHDVAANVNKPAAA